VLLLLLLLLLPFFLMQHWAAITSYSAMGSLIHTCCRPAAATKSARGAAADVTNAATCLWVGLCLSHQER
jgi:hypothetical protein